jgi:hypothetical protein
MGDKRKEEILEQIIDLVFIMNVEENNLSDKVLMIEKGFNRCGYIESMFVRFFFPKNHEDSAKKPF